MFDFKPSKLPKSKPSSIIASPNSIYKLLSYIHPLYSITTICTSFFMDFSLEIANIFITEYKYYNIIYV